MSSGERDNGLKTVSATVTLVINAGIFTWMTFASFAGASHVEVPEPEFIAMELVAPLAKKGVEVDPKQLKRIVAPAPPPEEPVDVAKLSRERKKEELEKKKKIKRLADEKKIAEAAKKQAKRDERKRKRQEKRDRKKAMADAMRNLDERADEDNPEGFAGGDDRGTSLDPADLRNKAAYASLVSTVLSRQFEVPATIPPEVVKRLEVHISLRVDETGKLKGKPKITKSSKNTFFDQAALRAVRRFGAGSALRIPLPTQKKLRRFVLKRGIVARMKK